MDACEQIDWVVYSKPPFGGPEKVLDYLGRYTHRIAISNHRLVNMEDGKVAFTWRDYSDGNLEKTMTLDADEFIRRFLMHVLPDGFVRIRYFGFLANCNRAKKLPLCRDLLDVTEISVVQEKSWPDLVLSLTGKDPLLCPKCQRGRLVRIQTLPPISRAHISHTRPPPGADLP